MNDAAQTSAGFVAVLGAPNAGKSTFVNRAVGAKVSIVSPKVQTTRTRVLGILIKDGAQILFVDTPGIFQPRRRLDRAMVASAWGSAGDADVILLMIDAAKGLDSNTRSIVDGLKQRKEERPKAAAPILVLNKVDAAEKGKLLTLAQELNDLDLFSDTFMISALTGDGVDDLVAFCAEHMTPGPWLFPEDQISDMPSRLLAAEVTREKLYLQLHQELPYAATVETETWTQQDDGSIKIEQVIFVERDSQKAIVLGKKGSRIKEIGAASRKELEDMFECRVHLFLFVKVREKWGDDPERYRDWGLDFNA
ncbi:MAG: GTPase Era [Rhodospirillales bacterium]|nr:GTPase Era [Rhodospirillales bacterium]MBO6786796.1 GTPase Era [Rhodospirillales bacterium]